MKQSANNFSYTGRKRNSTMEYTTIQQTGYKRVQRKPIDLKEGRSAQWDVVSTDFTFRKITKWRKCI